MLSSAFTLSHSYIFDAGIAVYNFLIKGFFVVVIMAIMYIIKKGQWTKCTWLANPVLNNK